jgi:hypothetical protein
MRNSFVFVLLLVAACSKDKAADPGHGSSPPTSGTETEATATARGVEAEIPRIKAALASAKPGDADAGCTASMTNLPAFEKEEKHKALAAELRQLCTVDLPAAKAKAGTP